MTLDQLLHIDAEGYDWKALSMFDLKKYSPSIILFEHKHLQKQERKASVAFLQAQYYIFTLGGDSLCLRKDVPKNEDWRQLQGELANPA